MSRAYDEIYLGSVCESQSIMFMTVAEHQPSVNMEQFIIDFLTSDVRRMIDDAWPKWACRPASELLHFWTKEYNYELPLGECHMDSDMAYWIGYFYAYYQWYWNVKSASLVKWLSPKSLGIGYPGMHDKDFDVLCEGMPPEQLYEWYLEDVVE